MKETLTKSLILFSIYLISINCCSQPPSKEVDSLFNARLSALEEIMNRDYSDVESEIDLTTLEIDLEIMYDLIFFFEKMSGIEAEGFFLATVQGKKLDDQILNQWQLWVRKNKINFYISENGVDICDFRTSKCQKL